MKIKEVIKAHGLTLEQVASKMPNSKTGETGISKQSMSLMINGNPTSETLRQIASIIGCDIMDFFKDEATHQEAPVPGNSITCPNCGCEIEFRAKQ